MDQIRALIKIDADQNKACEWLDDGLGLLGKGFFGFEILQELESLFFWIVEIFTWERDDDLFDDFEEFDGVDFLLEVFDKLSVKIKPNLAFDLWVEKESQDCHW